MIEQQKSYEKQTVSGINGNTAIRAICRRIGMPPKESPLKNA
ncbi:hypothetical protein PO124_04215 [Bacillus licheniformis]|nr:hypothetical protein [Bacillus licheniformis]